MPWKPAAALAAGNRAPESPAGRPTGGGVSLLGRLAMTLVALW